MKRFLLLSFWVLTATVVCSAQTTFYYPHVVNGLLGGTIWKTTIFLTNPSSGTASGTITLTQQNSTVGGAGSQFSSIAFIDQSGAPAGSGGIVTFDIPPGQTRKYVSTGDGAIQSGFATVVTTAGTVTGTAVFSEFDLGGNLISEAGVPAANAVPKQAVFIDSQGGFNVGVAYANPSTSAANVQLTLFDSSAATVATTTQLLGPGNHVAGFASTGGLFGGQPIPELAGTMQIQSDIPLPAIALRFSVASPAFTTLPPITLASLVSPALKWFEQHAFFNPVASIARLLGAFQMQLG